MFVSFHLMGKKRRNNCRSELEIVKFDFTIVTITFYLYRYKTPLHYHCYYDYFIDLDEHFGCHCFGNENIR